MTARVPEFTDEQRKAMCFSKRGYPTEKDARRAKLKREAKGAPSLRVYACPICGQFHITKEAQRT